MASLVLLPDGLFFDQPLPSVAVQFQDKARKMTPHVPLEVPKKAFTILERTPSKDKDGELEYVDTEVESLPTWVMHEKDYDAWASKTKASIAIQAEEETIIDGQRKYPVGPNGQVYRDEKGNALLERPKDDSGK